MAYHVLARVTLDSGVKLYSFADAGFISPSVYWSPRLLSVGSVSKSLSEEVGGPMSVGTMAVSLDDTDGTFLSLRTAEGWLNRKLEILLYDEDGTSYSAALSVIWEGEISNWASSESGDVFEIEAHDISEQRLDASLGTINPTDVLDTASFPNLPDSTPRSLAPLVIGKVTSDEVGGSNKGSVPAFLIDNSSPSSPVYAVCQGNAKTASVVPYRYGVKLTSGFTQSNATFGSRPYTILTFTSAQLDADRSNEQEITCDVEVLSDMTTSGTAITNPAAILERFLLQAGVSSGEIDSTSFTAAKNTFSGRGISGAFCLVDADQTIGDTLQNFGSSFNLSLTRTLTGKYGCTVPEPGAATAPITISEETIVRGSFAMRGPNSRATGATYRYLKDWRVDDESYHATASTSDPGEVSLLGRAVGRSFTLPFIRDGASAIKVVGDKLFSVSDKRVVVSVEALPTAGLLSDVDIGSTVSLLWRDGVIPFSATSFRVIARNLVFAPLRIQLTLASTTISAFTFGTEFLGIRQKPPPIRTDYDTLAGWGQKPGMIMCLGLKNNTR